MFSLSFSSRFVVFATMLFLPKLLFILTVVKVCYSQVETGQKISGNYVVKVNYMEPCEKRNDSEQMGYFNTRMSKNNRTHACLSGFFSLPYGLSDDMQETWELFSKGSTGGWKRFMTFKNKKACSDKRRLYPRWFSVLRIDDVPCPIPRGNYTFDCDNITGWKFSRAKVLTYGEYRAKINFFHNKVNVGCTDFHADVVPDETE